VLDEDRVVGRQRHAVARVRPMITCHSRARRVPRARRVFRAETMSLVSRSCIPGAFAQRGGPSEEGAPARACPAVHSASATRRRDHRSRMVRKVGSIWGDDATSKSKKVLVSLYTPRHGSPAGGTWRLFCRASPTSDLRSMSRSSTHARRCRSSRFLQRLGAGGVGQVVPRAQQERTARSDQWARRGEPRRRITSNRRPPRRRSCARLQTRPSLQVRAFMRTDEFAGVA